jgi:hypothetical protein
MFAWFKQGGIDLLKAIGILTVLGIGMMFGMAVTDWLGIGS